MRRLTLGPEDKQVRDWFRAACEKAGCEVHVDALGTMFAIRPGCDMSKPPIGIGSHLDTQPTGGKFDGILGTLAALEVVRAMNDAGIETEVPICVCNWTNEEGSRFAPAMMASAAYAGEYTTDDILSRKDAEGITVAQALGTIGYRGADAVGQQKFSAFVELHIEQGPLLEAEHKTIGVVDRGQGIIWYDGTITGFASHAGTTPMPLRRDALAAFSEVMLAVEKLARDHGPHAGPERSAKSGSTIPRATSFRAISPSPSTSAARNPRPSTHCMRVCRKPSRKSQPRRKVAIDVKQIWRKEPTVFDKKLVDAVANATTELGYSNRRITSGAGHDACNLATVMPAAMIFVPCKDGVSHNELEDATQADCTAGANVLLHTVLSLAGVASDVKAGG